MLSSPITVIGDIHGQFQAPIQTSKIDDDWIKEKNIEMDIILPFKNIETLDEEILKNADNSHKKWNDFGLEELLKHQLDKNDFNIK